MEIYTLGLSMITQLPICISSNAEPSKQQKYLSFRDKKSDQESFQIDYHHLSKLDQKKNKKKIKVGGWSAIQNQIYLKFMMGNVDDFSTQKARRATKVFYRLSKVLKKRTPDQCRSHHQKLQIKSQDGLNGIMLQVWKKIQKTIAQDFVNEHYRLYGSSVLFFKQFMSLQSQDLQNLRCFDEKKKKKSRLEWYNIKIINNNIKIQIKQEAVKNWN